MAPSRESANEAMAQPIRPNLRSSLGAAGICALLAVTAFSGVIWLPRPLPARSQAVEILKVDVNFVGRGYRATKLIGKPVVNNTNEKIGNLDDIILDRDRRAALYAILQVGSFLGLGGHLVAVPFESLVLDETGSKIELPGATREQLEKLTEFKYRT